MNRPYLLKYFKLCGIISFVVLIAFMVDGFCRKNNKDLEVSSKEINSMPTPISNTRKKLINSNKSLMGEIKEITNNSRPVSNEQFYALVIKDRDAAILYAMSVTDSDLRQDLLGTIADEWAKKDPQACFDWNMSLASPSDKKATLAVTMSSIVNSGEVKLAAKLISGIQKGGLKDTAIIYSFYQIAKEDVSTALNMISEMSDGGTLTFSAERLALMLNRESRTSEAREILNDLPPGTFRDYFGLGVVRNMAIRDPTAALDWIVANSDIILSDKAVLLVARNYGKMDPMMGIETASGIQEPGLREQYRKEIALSWSEEDPEAACSWLLRKISLSEYSQYSEISKHVIPNWIIADSIKALAAIESIQDSDSRDQAKIVAFGALSSSEPEFAAKSLLPLLGQDSSESRDAISKVTANWMNRDPVSASKWVGSLVEGPLKDVSIGQLVSNILSKDKDVVMANTWAALINDPKIRAQVNANINRVKP